MDIGLPDLDGIKVTQRIRQLEAANKLPNTPVIAVTAHPNRYEDELKIFNTECEKPFSDVVFEAMNKTLKMTKMKLAIVKYPIHGVDELNILILNSKLN